MGNDHGKQSSKKEPGGSSYRQDTAAERTHDQYHTALERGFKKYTAHRQPQEEKVFSRVDFTDRIFSLLPEIGELFFDYCKRTDGSNVKHEQGISCETYVSVFHDVMAATNSQLAQVYFKLFTQKSSNKLTQEDALRLLSLCRRASFLDVSMNISFDDPDNESIIQSLCKSLMKTEDIVVGEDDFCAWLYRMCPRLVQDLHRYVTCSLTGQERNPSTLSHQQESSSGGASSKKTLAGSLSVLTDCSLAGCAGQSTVWLCANLLPSSYIPSTNVMASLNYESHFNTAVQSWCVLYSSSLHGLSVNRFQHHLMGYSGVTLLFISFDKYLYTVAIDQPWKESRTRWGGTNSSFFQILPEFRLCQSGEGLIHYNLQDRTVPKGIHIGKDSRTTFLKIDEEMINVNYYSVDYKIKAISVWGCDARDKLEAFHKQKQWERREVDKQQNRKLVIEDWRESADRQILELGGVQTDHAQRGDI